MIESPVLQRFVAERMHRAILGILVKRFGALPDGLAVALDSVVDDNRLQYLAELAASCSSIAAFRQELTT